VTAIVKNYALTTSVSFEYDENEIDPFWYVDEGKRRWRMDGIYAGITDGIYAGITDEAGIWEHLAYNALVNGVTDASGLDGWGDLERGQLTASIVYGATNIEEV